MELFQSATLPNCLFLVNQVVKKLAPGCRAASSLHMIAIRGAGSTTPPRFQAGSLGMWEERRGRGGDVTAAIINDHKSQEECLTLMYQYVIKPAKLGQSINSTSERNYIHHTVVFLFSMLWRLKKHRLQQNKFIFQRIHLPSVSFCAAKSKSYVPADLQIFRTELTNQNFTYLPRPSPPAWPLSEHERK